MKSLTRVSSVHPLQFLFVEYLSHQFEDNNCNCIFRQDNFLLSSKGYNLLVVALGSLGIGFFFLATSFWINEAVFHLIMYTYWHLGQWNIYYIHLPLSWSILKFPKFTSFLTVEDTLNYLHLELVALFQFLLYCASFENFPHWSWRQHVVFFIRIYHFFPMEARGYYSLFV